MSKIIKHLFFVLLAALLPLSIYAEKDDLHLQSATLITTTDNGDALKQVTLNLQSTTVREALQELEVKGNVFLVYEKNDIDLSRKITVRVNNQTAREALNQILQGQELEYKVKGDHIIITRSVKQIRMKKTYQRYCNRSK